MNSQKAERAEGRADPIRPKAEYRQSKEANWARAHTPHDMMILYIIYCGIACVICFISFN